MPQSLKNGRYSVSQLQELSVALSVLLRQAEEFAKQAKEARGNTIKALGRDFSWAHIYEHPLITQLSMLLGSMGLTEKITEVALAEDPPAKIQSICEDDGELDAWFNEQEGELAQPLLIIVATVLHRNAHCMMLNQCSLDVLVNKVRQGDDEAFFQAVRVDRSILSCPPFADRLSRAELENDSQFFSKLAGALKGPRHSQDLSDKQINYVITALIESGMTSLSEQYAEELFINRLALVSPDPGSDPVPNLQRRFYRAKKKATT